MERKGIFWIWGSLILLTIIAWLSFFLVIQEDKKTLAEINDKLLIEQNISTNCSSTRDSLRKINLELSQFKTLTMAMVHRTEVTNQLSHKVGELVYMKNDSSKVVIEDVLIGGGKYNYYVKYKVLYKDQTTKEIVPELIY